MSEEDRDYKDPDDGPPPGLDEPGPFDHLNLDGEQPAVPDVRTVGGAPARRRRRKPAGQPLPDDIVDMKRFENLRPFKDIEWREVGAPRVWRPGEGEELIGYYMGKSVQNGNFGQYEVVQVYVPNEGMWTVSGTQIVRKVNANMVQTGTPVRIVYAGMKPLEDDKKMKVFELYLPKGKTP